MRALLSLIFILNLLNGSAYVPDSLLHISQSLKSDTQRVNLFYKEGFINRAIDPQYSFDCASLALQLAQKTNYPFYIAKAKSLMGVLYFRKHNFSKALVYHKEALKLRLLVNDKRGIAITQTNLANLYSELKYYTLSEAAYLKALHLNNELGDLKQMGVCLLNLGVLNADLKNYSAAENYFTKALTNSRSRYDYELEATCLNNLSVINIENNKPELAIANCINSIKAKELMDNEMEMADSYLNLALAYLKLNDSQQVLENLRIADSIILKYDYTSAKLNSLKIKADFYNNGKNFEAAFSNLSLYLLLKDSLELVEKEIYIENDFVERDNPLTPVKNKNYRFPYLYLNILIAVAILTFIMIFINRHGKER